MFAVASHEEIGRFGSRVLAGIHEPDAIIAVDVSHDYTAAPNIGDRKMTPQAMGEGFSLAVGAIVSEALNKRIKQAALKHDIPMQLSVVGRDTGTDGMAGVLASVDSAATSIGFPIRNMHTISESGHTGDLLASIHVIAETLFAMDKEKNLFKAFRETHPRLDTVKPLKHPGIGKAAASSGARKKTKKKSG